MESSLQYEAGPVRRDSFKILRNLMAKHDCDSRYTDTVSEPGNTGAYVVSVASSLVNNITLELTYVD